jgi:hypothetical protein
MTSIQTVRRIAAFCWMLCCIPHSNCLAQLPTAELHALSIQAAQADQSFLVKIEGQRLEESAQLLFTDLQGNAVGLTAQASLAPKQPAREWSAPTGEFHVTNTGQATPGIVEVRSLGRFGMSNPRRFLLSQLPVFRPTGDRSSTATAANLEPSIVISDRLQPLKSNFFRLTIEGPKIFSCAAYCKQIDSPADLLIRLWDGNGQLLRAGRSLGIWPAEISWKHAEEQSREYFVEISDILGRGGPEFNYLLESSLSSAKSEDSPEPRPEELSLNRLLRPTLDSPFSKERFLQPLAIDWIQAREKSTWQELPAEPVNEFPVRLRGDLSESRTVHFDGQKGQTLVFDVVSAMLDQLTDPAIVIYKSQDADQAQAGPDGLTLIAEQDDGPYLGTAAVRVRRLDPHLVWTVPETGRYSLVILDNQSGDRPTDSRGFFMEIRSPQPSFSLIAYRVFPSNDPTTSRPWGTNLMTSGTEQVHVTVARQDGFNGPVELRAQGLPDALKCHPVIVPAGVTEADLVIQAAAPVSESVENPESADLEIVNQKIVNLEIVGSAMMAEGIPDARAVHATISSGTLPTHNAVVSRHTALLEVAITAEDSAPLQVSLGDEPVVEVARNSKLAVTVRLLRGDGGGVECTLRPQSLPPKVTIAETKIPADQSEATVELSVAGDAPLGEFTFWLQTEARIKWRANPQALTREEEYLQQLNALLDNPESGDAPAKTENQLESAESTNQNRATEESPSGTLTDENSEPLLSTQEIEAQIASVTQRIEQLKKDTAEQEVLLWLPSNSLRIRIVESPSP